MFVEERLPVEIDYGSSFGELYKVDLVVTSGGHEYRRLIHPIPQLIYDVAYDLREQTWLVDEVLDLYHRCFGMFAGFRVRNLADYSTNGYRGVPTATDQELALVSAGVYQLQKAYGTGPISAAGNPIRTIFKPVSGTVLVSISDIPTTGFTVDTTDGQVTFAADKTRAVTAITQAANAEATVGSHTFLAGESVHFFGVVGMTEINGLRGEILSVTATTIVTDIDSSAFTAYSSGGNVHTRPQTGESVKGGCEFDFPVRWNSDLSGIDFSQYEALSTNRMEIVELLNP